MLREGVHHLFAFAQPQQPVVDEHAHQLIADGAMEQVLLDLRRVDSSVVAALLHRAIGDQLVCVFVDHGLLRLGEGEQVMNTFAQHLGVRVLRVDAQARFLTALAGVTDPEAKRKIIGRTFVEVFDEQAQQLRGVQFLAQGPSTPTSSNPPARAPARRTSSKSHHNVGGLPEKMHLQLLEPLRELFKDEVRRLGIELGLPREMVHRHPFPGPAWACGSSARCAGNTPSCCGAPTPSTSRSCASTISTTASARRSRSSCRCARWASWAMDAATTT